MFLFRRLTVIALGAFTLSFGAVGFTAQAQATLTPSPTNTYIVQPGDNLYQIGLKFGLSYATIAAANGIVNPDLIIVGQVLTIPAGGVIGTPVPSATASQTPVPSATLPLLGGPNAPTFYMVQSGDLLYKIAAEFHTSVLLLGQLNNLSNVNLIYVGQILKLPVSGVVENGGALTATALAVSATALSVQTNSAPTTQPTTTPVAPATMAATTQPGG